MDWNNTFSPSKLKTYDGCKLQFKLHYVDKIRPPQPVTSDLQFGSFVHKFAELYDGSNIKELVKLQREFVFDATYKEATAQTLKNFIKFYDKYDKYDFESEQSFSLDLEDYSLYGIIDRIMNTKKGRIVVDYKTSKSPNRDRHIFQMRFYNLMVSKKYNIEPKDTKCLIYYPRIDVEDIFLFSNKEIEVFGKQVEDKIKKIRTEEKWNPNKGYHCKWCAYKESGHCPIWKNK